MVVEHPPHEQARAGALVDAEAGAELVLQEVARPVPDAREGHHGVHAAPVHEGVCAGAGGRGGGGRHRAQAASDLGESGDGQLQGRLVGGGVGGGLHGVVDAAQRRAKRSQSGAEAESRVKYHTRGHQQPASKMALPCALSMRDARQPSHLCLREPGGHCQLRHGTQNQIGAAARANKASTDTEEEEEEEEEDATSVASCAIQRRTSFPRSCAPPQQ